MRQYTALSVIGLAALLFTGTNSAQSLEKVLIPVAVVDPIPGGFDSIWVTEFVGINLSGEEAIIRQNSPEPCVLAACPIDRFPDGRVFSFTLSPGSFNGGPMFLWVEERAFDQVELHLRVQDTSRQALTWGTSIPIVPERDAFTKRFLLMDVPTDGRFRQTLRVYDFDGLGVAQARIRIFSQDEVPMLLAEAVVTIEPVNDLYPQPGIAQIGFLSDAFPVIATSERVFVEVTPMSELDRLWGFISVTNNETQHVTVIEPN